TNKTLFMLGTNIVQYPFIVKFLRFFCYWLRYVLKAWAVVDFAGATISSMLSIFRKLSIALAGSIILGSSYVAAQSSGGRLVGKITDVDGKPVGSVTIIVINQTNSDRSERQSDKGGKYVIKLRKGAYRISVLQPYEARFDRGKID